jgi:hypothetical protein
MTSSLPFWRAFVIAVGVGLLPVAGGSAPPVSTAQAEMHLEGTGFVGGKAATGRIFMGMGKRYALMINTPTPPVTCSGIVGDAPGTHPSVSTHISCTNGAHGTAVITVNRDGRGYFVSFSLSNSTTGYVLLH